MTQITHIQSDLIPMDRLSPEYTSYREFYQSLYHNKGFNSFLLNELSTGISLESYVEAICFILDRPHLELSDPLAAPMGEGAQASIQLTPGFRGGEMYAAAITLGINQPRTSLIAQTAPVFREDHFSSPSYDRADIIRLLRSQYWENGDAFREAVMSTPLQNLYQKIQMYPYHLLPPLYIKSLPKAVVWNSAFGTAAQQNNRNPGVRGGVLTADEKGFGDSLINWLGLAKDEGAFPEAFSISDANAVGIHTQREHSKWAQTAIDSIFFNLFAAGDVGAFDGIFGDEAEVVYTIHPTSPFYDEMMGINADQYIPQIPSGIAREFTETRAHRMARKITHANVYKTKVAELKADIEIWKKKCEELEKKDKKDDQDEEDEKEPQSAEKSATESDSTVLADLLDKIDYAGRSIFVYEEYMNASRQMFIYFATRFGVSIFSPLQLASCYITAKIYQDQEIVTILELFGINMDNWLEYSPEMRRDNLNDSGEEFAWFYDHEVVTEDQFPKLAEKIQPYTNDELLNSLFCVGAFDQTEFFKHIYNLLIDNTFKEKADLFHETLEAYNQFYNPTVAVVDVIPDGDDKKTSADVDGDDKATKANAPVEETINQEDTNNATAIAPSADDGTGDNEKDQNVTEKEGEEQSQSSPENEEEKQSSEKQDEEKQSSKKQDEEKQSPSPLSILHAFHLPTCPSTNLAHLDTVLALFANKTWGDFSCDDGNSWSRSFLLAISSPSVAEIFFKGVPITHHTGGGLANDLYRFLGLAIFRSSPVGDVNAIMDHYIKFVHFTEEQEKINAEKEKAEKEKAKKATTATKGSKSTTAKKSTPGATKDKNPMAALMNKAINKKKDEKLPYFTFLTDTIDLILSPISSSYRNNFESIITSLDKLTSNKAKLPFIESGSFSIASNRKKYVELMGGWVRELPVPRVLNPVLLRSRTQFMSKLASTLIRPVYKHASSADTFPFVLQYLTAVVEKGLIDTAEVIINNIAPALKAETALPPRFILSLLSLLGGPTQYIDLNNYIEIPDIDAVLYKHNSNKGNISHDDEDTPPITCTNFSIFRTNHLLRFLPNDSITRAAFPEFYNYIPSAPVVKNQQEDENGDEKMNESENDTVKLIFNINSLQALQTLPPPSFSLVTNPFNLHSRLVSKDLICTDLMQTLMSVKQESGEESEMPSSWEQAQLTASFSKMGAKFDPFPNYLVDDFMLDSHRFGKFDEETVNKSPEQAPDVLYSFYITKPSVLTMVMSGDNNLQDPYIPSISSSSTHLELTYSQPYLLSQVVTYKPVLSPHSITNQANLETSLKMIDFDKLSSSASSTSTSIDLSTAYKLYISQEMVDPGVSSIDFDQRGMDQVRRGMQYLQCLIKMNENNPIKSQRHPGLRLFKCLQNIFGVEDFMTKFTKLMSAPELSCLILNAIRSSTPLVDAFVRNSLTVDEASTFATHLYAHLNTDITVNPWDFIIRERYRAAQTLILFIGASQDAERDCYYTIEESNAGYNKMFSLPPPGLIDDSKAILFDPSDPKHREGYSPYYYNTPGMKMTVGGLFGKYHKWLESRPDVVEYMRKRQEYLDLCRKTQTNPIHSLLVVPSLTTPTETLSGSDDKKKQLDWEELLRPKSLLIEEQDLLQELNQLKEEKEQQQQEQLGDRDYTAQELKLGMKSLAHNDQEVRNRIGSYRHYSKNLPTWFAWKWLQFINSPTITSLNQPPDELSKIWPHLGQDYYPLDRNFSPRTPQNYPDDVSTPDDYIINFTHTQFSMLNARFCALAEDLSATCLLAFYSEIVPLVREFAIATGDPKAWNSSLDFKLPKINLRTIQACQVMAPDYITLLAQHIHDIPKNIDLPLFYPPRDQDAELFEDPDDRIDLVRRSRHLPFSVIRCLLASSTVSPDGNVELYELFVHQCKGVPFSPSVAPHYRMVTEGTAKAPYFVSDCQRAHSMVSSALYSKRYSYLIPSSDEYAGVSSSLLQMLLQSAFMEMERHQNQEEERLQKIQQAENSSFWTKVAGAVGLTAAVLGAGAWWWANNTNGTDTTNTQQKEE